MKIFLIKEIKYTILYCVFVRTFVVPFYYGSVIIYGSGSTRQKVTVPTVPVSQNWRTGNQTVCFVQIVRVPFCSDCCKKRKI
jgi:hypothetical protein